MTSRKLRSDPILKAEGDVSKSAYELRIARLTIQSGGRWQGHEAHLSRLERLHKAAAAKLAHLEAQAAAKSKNDDRRSRLKGIVGSHPHSRPTPCVPCRANKK